MKTLQYETYIDKVYGCWLGKCSAGTIGAPYEGMKELLDIKYSLSLVAEPLPNDDLDLQVLWLSVLEEVGERFTSMDLAAAFAGKCPYAPGEYAIFKKNFKRGIYPPLSGLYNNRYYLEGMGSPIRSEIWACIAPGNPSAAARFAESDAVLDHHGNSVYAEMFFAAMESAAFFDSDIHRLVDVGLSVVPSESRISNLIRDVREWCSSSGDWKYVRSKVLHDYGHPDCTNLFQNMGITLLALFLGEGDFLKTTMMALNCGFDTDCTCASAGALLGILIGGGRLSEEYALTDTGYILEVDVRRRSASIFDLAEDTAAVGLHFAALSGSETKILNAPFTSLKLSDTKPSTVRMEIDYKGCPAVGIGDSKSILISIANSSDSEIRGQVSLETPPRWDATLDAENICIPGKSERSVEAKVVVPGELPVISETNICRARFDSAETGSSVAQEFGLVGAVPWGVCGPFWENVVEMPTVCAGESYYKYIGGSTPDETADRTRGYHLNTRADLDKEYMSLRDLETGGIEGDASTEIVRKNIYEDLFSVEDLIGFKGPCVIYAVRKLVCPEDRTVHMQIGHTDSYIMWLNGELVSERTEVDWWTYENAHVSNVSLRAGLNTIVLRLARRGKSAEFSLVFTKGGPCTDHYTDLASKNPLL